jgi:hypothetical protein
MLYFIAFLLKINKCNFHSEFRAGIVRMFFGPTNRHRQLGTVMWPRKC